MGTESPTRRRSERALLDSEHGLQQVLDNSSAIVFAKDLAGRYIFVNREFERVTGKVAADMLGRTDEAIFPPHLAVRFRRNDLRVLLEKRSFQFEEAADFGSGLRTFLSSKFPLIDAEGDVYAVCGMSTDITDRKRMEDAFSAAALAVSQSEEETLYRQLARYLSTILGVDGAFIATVNADRPNELQMLAFHLDGSVQENFTYPMVGTPCETVVGQCYRLYPERLTELFPLDADFNRLGMQSYAGHPLAAADGRPLGLIAVISRRPFEDSALVEATLRIFAVRVIAELERAEAAAALRASEANYREIFEASEDAILVHDWDTGAIVDANPRACDAYGCTRAELIGLKPHDLGAGEQPVSVEDAMRGVEDAKRIGSATFEWRRRRKDGSLHWDEVRLRRARIGGQWRVLAFTREITERKAAEEALRASEEQYRAIFNASDDAMVLWDSRFRRVDVNPAFERLYGWTREEVTGHGVEFPDFSPEHVAARQDIVRRALAGESCHAEHELVVKSGARVQAEVRAVPFMHAGRPHVLTIARDITEQKRAEAALRASEEQYRAVFNASADALVLWNSRYERVDVNPAYERMYGYTREEVIAGARNAEVSEAHRRQQAELIARTLDGEHCRRESETFRRDGSRFPIEVRTIPIQYHGEPHVLAMIRDLTERARVESERAELEAQLRQAQKMEAIGQLAGGIAHDFNNLLTSIMGYVLLASQREAAAGDVRLGGYLQQAQRSCERARDLIQQMLMFSRGQRGSPRPVSLASVVRGALGTLQAGLPETIEIDLALDSALPAVHADPAQIEQVLLNLCLNARDAMAGVGQLKLGVALGVVPRSVCASCRQAVDGDFVQLAVEDDGHGMSPEVMERIFEPFYSTKESGKGSGMGLAMVHGIVHEHGGHVVVESRAGEGTRFRILLPALPGQVTQADTSEAPVPARPPRPALKGSVLVVDDEETVGEFMRELLGTWGLDATCLHRPEAALEIVQAEPHRFDVVITDQSMPRLTGLELARRVKLARADLPVVLYTGHGDGLSEGDAQAAGVVVVMRKPIDPVQLSQVLSGCLASGRSTRQPD